MRYISIALLVVLLGYSLTLVFLNDTAVQVNLLFSQVPAMRLGLLLVLTLALGIVLGLLIGLQLFGVFQSKWEIKRLRKDVELLRKEQLLAAQQAAAEAAVQAQQLAHKQAQLQTPSTVASTEAPEKVVTNIPTENKSPL